MLIVTFVYDEHGFPISVEANGHADWATLGRDIVCAAVSTVLQSTWLGLAQVAGISVEGVRESGRLAMSWPCNERRLDSVVTLVVTADLTIEQLANQYPRNVAHHRRGDTIISRTGTASKKRGISDA